MRPSLNSFLSDESLVPSQYDKWELDHMLAIMTSFYLEEKEHNKNWRKMAVSLRS